MSGPYGDLTVLSDGEVEALSDRLKAAMSAGQTHALAVECARVQAEVDARSHRRAETGVLAGSVAADPVPRKKAPASKRKAKKAPASKRS